MLANRSFGIAARLCAAVVPLLVAGFLAGEASAASFSESQRQSGARAMLVQPEELQKDLQRPGLRILDTRPPPQYAKAHIPGAIRVDVRRWQQLGGREGGFHDAQAWAKEVGQLGIALDTAVVVYGSQLTDTARVWWTLKYLGLESVAILDGGWERWLKEKRPTDASSPRLEAVTFRPNFQADRLEEMNLLRNDLRNGKVTLVDARSEGEFTGKDVRAKRGGHIPGATLLEWKELLADDGRFKSPEQLRTLFRQRGIHPDQTTVTC
jgi:thiosulfate/3-mercaptopyruvate sulfurtransferase